MYKIEDLKKKSEKELLQLISELKGKLLALRFENATGQLNESHLLKESKKDIAKIFTILRDKNVTTIPTKETKNTSKKEKVKSKKDEPEEAKIEEPVKGEKT